MNSKELEETIQRLLLSGYIHLRIATKTCGLGKTTLDGKVWLPQIGWTEIETFRQDLCKHMAQDQTGGMFKQKDVDACTLPASEGEGIYSLSDLLLDLYEHEQEGRDVDFR